MQKSVFSYIIGDLKNWEKFVEKYAVLTRKMKEQDIETDGEKELSELKDYRERLLAGNMIQDTTMLVRKIISEKKKMLVEGANAIMLDVDFGTYPFCTSSNTGIGMTHDIEGDSE